MKYPKRSHYLKIEMDKKEVQIQNALTGVVKTINDKYYADFLLRLDGRVDPYKIDPQLSKEEVDEILDSFYENDFLFDGKRIHISGFGSVIIRCWVPKLKKWYKAASLVWNYFILLFSIPILLKGIQVYTNSNYQWIGGKEGLVVGGIVGYISAFLFHELSHASSCLCYGGEVYEMGIMLKNFIPGAYTLMQYENIDNRFKRIQILASGVEMNFFLTGLFLWMLKLERWNTGLLLMAAIVNAVLGQFNLCLMDGLDGMKIISEILEIEDFAKRARKLIYNKTIKRRFLKKGVNGKAIIAVCYLITGVQLLTNFSLILFIIIIVLL